MVGLDEAVREAAFWEVDKPREEWLFGFPAELALLAGQVGWAVILGLSVYTYVVRACTACSTRGEDYAKGGLEHGVAPFKI